MKVSDLTVEVRDASLQRVGVLTAKDLVGFTAVLRFNNVGSWRAVLPVGHPLAELLRLPGYGVVVTAPTGVLLSGPTTAVVTNQSTEDAAGTYTISGVDDSVLLSDHLAYPTPTTADVTAQTSAYDVRSGVAETVMKGFVSANIGSSAPSARKVTALTVPASAGLGASVTAQARFHSLQEILANLADVAGLGFTIEQNGSVLEFQVFQPVDRSALIRLDLDNGRLTKSEYSFSQPKATRVIVGGSGDLTARTFLERTSAASLTAESAWGRRIEVFSDQRSTAETAKLQQYGDELLASDGKTLVSVSISPSDDQSMLFGVDWNLGDKVTCVVGSVELVAVVTEVGILVSSDGVRIGATVGEPRGLDYESQVLAVQASQASRISNLERTK